MKTNIEKLKELSKPRSDESIAKEKYWNDHKEEIIQKERDYILTRTIFDWIREHQYEYLVVANTDFGCNEIWIDTEEALKGFLDYKDSLYEDMQDMQ